MIFFSRLLEGEYLDYKRALPNNNKIFAAVKRSEFIESAERASLLVDEKLRTPLRCRFEDGNLNISCSTQYGSVNDNLKISKQGDDIEIGFNNRYVLDALRAAPTDELTLQLSSPTSPCVILPASGDGSFLYLILPVRIRTGE